MHYRCICVTLYTSNIRVGITARRASVRITEYCEFSERSLRLTLYDFNEPVACRNAKWSRSCAKSKQ